MDMVAIGCGAYMMQKFVQSTGDTLPIEAGAVVVKKYT
jgi:hypothetical protein